MLNLRSLYCASALVALIPGCPKKPDASLPDATIVLDASPATVPDASVATPDASTDTVVDASSPVPAATGATAPAPHGCPTGKVAFIVDGKSACESECGLKGKSNECALPLVCIGRSPLAGAEAGAAVGSYCRTPPSGACPAVGQAQFWGNGGKPVCETLCAKDNDPACAAPATCKGNGQLVAVDGKMGQGHRYCRK